MANKIRILFGVTYQSHTELGLDEMYGLQELGYTCEHFEYGGKKEARSSLGRLVVLLQNAFGLLIKTYRFKPDCIYFNSRLEFIGSTRDFLTILLIKMFYYRRLFFMIKSHGSDLEVLESRKFFYSRIVFPFLKRNVIAWLFLSNEEVSWIKSRKLMNQGQVFLTKNIVRIEKFQTDPDFRRKLGISPDHKILLFVGRLIEEKGIHYVIDAFAEIRKLHQQVVLIVIGDGEEFVKVQNRIQELDMADSVITTGWVDEKTAAYYTSNSDLLVFPTFFPEGFSMVLFNSLAAGLSVVTTPIRAAIDYLKEPDNCLWVEPRSAISVKNSVDRLLKDEPLMQRMRANNKEKAHLFTRQVVAGELAAVVESCCQSTIK